MHVHEYALLWLSCWIVSISNVAHNLPHQELLAAYDQLTEIEAASAVQPLPPSTYMVEDAAETVRFNFQFGLKVTHWLLSRRARPTLSGRRFSSHSRPRFVEFK